MKTDELIRYAHLAGKAGIAAITAAILAAGVHFKGSGVAENAVNIPPPAIDVPAGAQDTRATAVVAGGCFWGVQAVFQHTRGVVSAVSGYTGGRKDTASYERVSGGDTGHAEAVQITFDPKQISYGKLLQIYFSVAHDPTQLNRQFPDSGPQYRSAVFYTGADQQRVAQRYIAQLDAAHVFPSAIVTQVTPFDAFYPAETYHQDYATTHPESPYIATFDLPKVASLKRLFPDVYRDVPVLVGTQAAASVVKLK
jgi:peptide-methionine (S)-S-oxide reductase